MVSLKCKEVLCIVYTGLLFISGIILIGFSVVLLYRMFYHFDFVPADTIGPFILMFILGFLHLFLTWLGFKGPIRQQNFHIIMFMVFTSILIVCELAVGIWLMILWGEISMQAFELMSASFNEMVNFDKKEWSKLQSNLKCCGLDGVEDYHKIKNSTPVSCTNPDLSNITVHYIYEDGCQRPFLRYLKKTLTDGAIIVFTSGIFQGLGIYLFYSFFSALREERKEILNRRLAEQRESSHGQNPSDPATSSSTPNVPPTPTS